MRQPLFLRLFALVLAAAWTTACAHQRELALPQPGRGPAAPLPVASHQTTPEEKAFWNALAGASVIYISETHDRESDHEYQFDVLRGLRTRGVGYAVGWEMFETPQQPVLDSWQRGELSTEVMLERVEFQQHWGKLSPLYEKMLRWTRQENVDNVALNAPAVLSSKLARGEPLGDADRPLIPAGYRPLPGGFEHFTEQMGQHPHAGASGTEGLKNFYRAQLLWDQTMAERIVSYLSAHPNGKLVVLLGRGHVESGFGVPAFVKQKTGAKQLVLYPGESGRAPQGSNTSPRLARDAARHRVWLAWLEKR